MRILFSFLLVAGIVAGIGSAIRGPHWHGHPYAYGYGPCGPAGPGYYGGPGWNAPGGAP